MDKQIIDHSWCYDNYSLEQSIEFIPDQGKLALYREANVMGHYELLVTGDLVKAAEKFAALKSLPHDAFVKLMEGAHYGADLRDIATHLGLVYIGPTPAEETNLPEFPD